MTPPENTEMCPICLDVLSEKSSLLPCNHQFDLSCIKMWCHENNRCPLCRQAIDGIQHEDNGTWSTHILLYEIAEEEEVDENSYDFIGQQDLMMPESESNENGFDGENDQSAPQLLMIRRLSFDTIGGYVEDYF